MFTSPSSLATLFRPLDAESSSNIDVLLIGLGTGSIHITISSSFTIGTFGIPSLQSKTAIHTLTSHTSHPSFSVHGLLMRSSSKLVSGLSFVPIDLSFLDTSSEYLGLLASKATALQNLLRYLSETQKVLVTEFTTGRELPGRYLSNLQDLFEERGSSWTVVPALYHQVLTGHSIPEVREWLSEIADRGHKRWSKAVLSSFTSLRSLIHRKLIPTLTRIAAICSRLHGLALYHTPPSSSSKPCILGFSAQQIKGILDTVAGLTLVAEHMLTLVVEDLDNWGTFEEWLGYEVAHAITDKKPTEEELEKESSINHSKVLSYIQSSLVSHNLDPFLREVEKDEAESYFAYDEAEPMFETLTTELRALDTTEKKPAPSPLPNLRVLIDRLQRLSSAVFDGIASTQARGVHIGKPITISEGKTRGPCYIRMMPSPSASETVSLAPSSKDGSDETMTDQYPDPSADGDPEEGVSHTYIAQIGGDRESIQLHLIKLRTENGLTKQISKQIGLFYLGLGIVDIAFYSDDYIIVLYTNLKRVGSHLERSMIPSPPNAKKNGKRDDDEERFFLALVPYREGKLLAGYREVGKGFKPYEGEGEARGLSRRATDVVSEAGNWEITGCGVDGDEPGGGGGDEEWIPERVVVREPGVVVVLGGGGGGRYGVYRVTESGVQTA